MDYVFSDPHFSDKVLVEKVRTQFNNIQEHDEYIIKKWNKTIIDNVSKIYVLGDLGGRECIERILPQLKGYKILIKGNHDNLTNTFYRKYFDEVYDTPIFYHKRIVLSHIPIPVEAGVFNLHGHTHNISLDSKWHINVSAERIDYTPQKMNNYIKLLGSVPKPNIKFLQEWYKDIQITHVERDSFIIGDDGRIDAEKTLLPILKAKEERRKIREERIKNEGS